MINKYLTKIEKRFAKNLYEGEGLKYNHNNIDIKFIRKLMKETAYHEAGHFAARVFTGFELHRVQFISIIPDKKNLGRVRYDGAVTEYIYINRPEHRLKPNGYMLLLDQLAGFGAQMIYEKSKHNTLIDYLYEEQDEAWNDYFDDNETDINRARKIASSMSKPHWSQDRILIQAARWTLEMLRIPSVWNIVKTTAKILLSKGEVTLNNREISKLIYDSNFKNIYHLPKWKQRIKL